MERLSRSVWAPATSGAQHQTIWYYERARGQYADDRERERTPAAKRKFDLLHPTAQRFSKTDLAKFEHTWDQHPHLVSRGAEKNFAEFMIRLNERGGFEPDQRYFERLCARGLLFRTTEKLVQAQRFGGYRANIVTYALAWLSHATAQRLDLDCIWQEQAVPSDLQEVIIAVSHHAHEHIVQAPGNGNVTEWCKKEECWKRFRDIEIDIPRELPLQEQQIDTSPEKEIGSATDGIDAVDRATIERVARVEATTWFSLAAWAKETASLEPWQRSLAFSLGRLASSGREPSRKQVYYGIRILEEAARLGFALSDSALTS